MNISRQIWRAVVTSSQVSVARHTHGCNETTCNSSQPATREAVREVVPQEPEPPARAYRPPSARQRVHIKPPSAVELGRAAEAGLRDRHASLRKLRRRVEDHRGDHGTAGDREEPHAPRFAGLGAAARASPSVGNCKRPETLQPTRFRRPGGKCREDRLRQSSLPGGLWEKKAHSDFPSSAVCGASGAVWPGACHRLSRGSGALERRSGLHTRGPGYEARSFQRGDERSKPRRRDTGLAESRAAWWLRRTIKPPCK